MTTPDEHTEPTDPVTRVRYFDGQFLTHDDLVTDQDYHVRNTRGLAAALGARGVVEGLGVTQAPLGGWMSIQVARGWAIDGAGRLLRVPANVSVELPKDFAHEKLRVYLAYARWPDTLVPSGSSTEQPARWTEIPVVVVSDGTSAPRIVRADGADPQGYVWPGETESVLLVRELQFTDGDTVFIPGIAGEPIGIAVPAPARVGDIRADSVETKVARADSVEADVVRAGSVESNVVRVGAPTTLGDLTVDSATSAFRPAGGFLWSVNGAADDTQISGKRCGRRLTGKAPTDGFLSGIVYERNPVNGGILVMSVLDEPQRVRLAAASVRGQGWNSLFLPVAKGTRVHLELGAIRSDGGYWAMEFRWTGLGDATQLTLENVVYDDKWIITLA